MHARGAHLQCTGTGHQGPLRSSPVAHHHTPTRLVNQPLVPFDVIGDLDLEASHQHPQRPRRDQLIERTGQVIAVSVIGDYLQHQAYSFPAGQHQRNP
jgi:hypothetical protein